MTDDQEIRALLADLLDRDTRDALEREGVHVVVEIDGEPADDIGELLKKVKAEVWKSRERAQQLASVGALGAGLVHEARNLMGAVRAYSQMAQQATNEGDKAHLLCKRVEGDTRRVLELLGDFLQLARNRQISRKRVLIRDWLKRLGLATKHQLNIHNVRLRIDSEAGDAAVIGCRDSLLQASINLVLNAQQAMLEGGSVCVEFQRSEGMAIISIVDDGPGMDEELQRRVFEPFFTTKSSGTGLGLAICRRIIEEHDGRLELSSEVGVGTTFRIMLPLQQQQARGTQDLGLATGGK